jgi:hypothetical protein
MERKDKGEKDFGNLLVHVVCKAGSDRSRLIAEELNKRGYLATHGGIDKTYNYTTPEDLVGVGTIIFTSDYIRDVFKTNKELTRVARLNNAKSIVLCISEEEKEHAFQAGSQGINKLRKTIADRLDIFGFEYKKMKY